jgi:hypothetical protein
MSSVARIPFAVNPHLAAAAAQLAILLDDYSYSAHARDRIVAYTIANGTPTGCPELDREDEHDAEMVFTSELPAVPFDSPAWDRDIDVVTLDVEMIEAGTHPFPLMDPSEVDGPDAPDYGPSWSDHLHALITTGKTLPLPISGGAPEPYEATPEDLEDYDRWSEEVARRRAIESQRAWYRRNPLSRFNAERID